MKKAVITIIIGAVLFIFSIIMPFLAILSVVMSSMGSDNQFLAPGSLTVTVPKDGRYYLWNNYQTVFQDKSYNSSREIPNGLIFTLTNTETKQTYKLISDSSTTVSSGSSQKVSIGYYDLKKGKYLIKVSGSSNGPRVFSFSKSIAGSIMVLGGTVFAAFGLAFVGFVIFIIGVILLIKHLLSKKNTH